MLTPHVIRSDIGGRFRPNAVTLNGSTRLDRGAAISSDSKLYSGSLWFRPTSLSGVAQRILHGSTSIGTSAVGRGPRVSLNPSNQITVVGLNSAGAAILNQGFTESLSANTWYHICWFVDMTSTSLRGAYINDASQANFTTYTNDNINWGCAECSIGGRANGSEWYNGQVANILIWNSYIDFSVEGNRRAVITAAKKPVHSDLSVAFLGTPILRFDNAAASFGTNAGSGGNFTVAAGSLSDFTTTNPAD